MTARRLSADEAQAWGRVMASVRPMRAMMLPINASPGPGRPSASVPAPLQPSPLGKVARHAAPKAGFEEARKSVAIGPGSLDGGWDKRLARGLVAPDGVIDLHGHSLASAHAALDRGIDRARGRGDRLLLLVTGKPPRPESERPHRRGAIRAAVTDWLAASRHADAIAAVRGAHPRHGGQGALYLVLRRTRGR